MSEYLRRLLMAALAASALALLVYRTHLHTTQEHPSAHFTPEQIVTLSAPLCHDLFPDVPVLQLRADYINNPDATGLGHFWSVDCFNTQGILLAQLLRSDTTGTLSLVNCPQAAAPPPHACPLTRVQALGYAQHWQQCLHLPGSWHLAGDPVRKQLRWYVRFQGCGRNAEVWINAFNGALCLASIH